MSNINYIRDWIWIDYDELGSTNDVAIDFSKNSSGKNFVITTKSQTNGRGRTGRSWISLEGNLFMSMGVEFNIRELAALVFMVSLSLLNTIKHICVGSDVLLKWPNDVLLNGKKVSGILLEKGSDNYMIVGIGVNIVSSPENSDLLYPATNLASAGIKIDRIEFLKQYLMQFEQIKDIYARDGVSKIVELWLSFAKGVGKNIIVRTPKESKQGVFVGIDNDGRLLLQTLQGLEKILAGDVFFDEKV